MTITHDEPLVRRHRFTVDDYHRMAEAGVLHEDDRVELLDGEVVVMSPIGDPHAACVKRLNRHLGSRVGARAIVSVQDPIQLDAHSEPQPDVALLRPRDDFYGSATARPEDRSSRSRSATARSASTGRSRRRSMPGPACPSCGWWTCPPAR